MTKYLPVFYKLRQILLRLNSHWQRYPQYIQMPAKSFEIYLHWQYSASFIKALLYAHLGFRTLKKENRDGILNAKMEYKESEIAVKKT